MIVQSFWNRIASNWIVVYTEEDRRTTNEAADMLADKNRITPEQKLKAEEDLRNFLTNMEDDEDEF